MTSVNLNDVEMKIDLVASLENCVKIGNSNNHFQVDWNLTHLNKFNNRRIFLVLENGVFIPTFENQSANNKSAMLLCDGIQFRNRYAGVIDPQMLCFIKNRITSSHSIVGSYDNPNNIGSENYIFEIERIPDKTLTFKLVDTRLNNGVRDLAITSGGNPLFQFIDLQFSILIMKSMK